MLSSVLTRIALTVRQVVHCNKRPALPYWAALRLSLMMTVLAPTPLLTAITRQCSSFGGGGGARRGMETGNGGYARAHVQSSLLWPPRGKSAFHRRSRHGLVHQRHIPADRKSTRLNSSH